MTDPDPKPTTTLSATCHCKSSTLTFTVPTKSLPLPTHFCHCSICRRTHGSLASVHAPVPRLEGGFGGLTGYKSSDRVVRYFCSTCGAHFGDYAKEADGEQWCVAAAMVDAPEESWEFKEHIFVESTRDGGLATWIPSVSGKDLDSWNERGGGDGIIFSGASHQIERTGAEEKLHAHCHCGGISFYISRPTEVSWKDIDASLIPKDKMKWYASHDVCISCRLVTGSPIISWVFPSISNITLADGSPYTPIFGTAKIYKSSHDVTRTFCGTCGATVTYACDDRPGMVDVAVGLLDAEGVRAEKWLEWRTGRVSWEKDAVWEELVGGFKEGLSVWGKNL